MKNKFTSRDIEVFIPTYNRARFLTSALESVLAQSAGKVKITVLDNASDDNTRELMQDYAKRGVNYYRAQSNSGGFANFKKAQELAEAPYIIYFHDDDIMHPKYLESILKGLNAFPNIAIAASMYTWFNNHEGPPKTPAVLKNKYLFSADSADMAASLLDDNFTSCVCSAVVRKDAFKAIVLEPEKFGKLNDWPAMINAAARGNFFILTDKNAISCRVHPARDSNDEATGITALQLKNWFDFFFRLLIQKRTLFFIKEMSRVILIQYREFVSSGQKKEVPFDAFFDMLYSDKNKPVLRYINKAHIFRRRSLFYRVLSRPIKWGARSYLGKYVASPSAPFSL